VQVYDCPRFLLKNPTDLSHSIYFPNENLKLHLQLDGVISYLPVQKPSPEEFRNFHKLTLTYDNPIWDPYLTDFTHQEEKYTNSKGILVTRQSGHANIQMILSHESTVSVVLSSILVSLDELFHQLYQAARVLGMQRFQYSMPLHHICKSSH
jgi:hypothetical protein